MRALLLCLILVIAACSGGTRELGIRDEPPGSIPPPTTELAAEDEPWVEFEARWLCDLQRSTYPDPSDVQAALEDRLAEEGIDADQYASFQQRLDEETELARHVQAAVLARCGS